MIDQAGCNSNWMKRMWVSTCILLVRKVDTAQAASPLHMPAPATEAWVQKFVKLVPAAMTQHARVQGECPR